MKNHTNSGGTAFAMAACIISAIAVAVSTFLPYISATIFGSSLSKSLIEGDGIFFIVLAAIALICSITKAFAGTTVFGVIILGLFAFENLNTSNTLNSAGEYAALAKSMIQYGAGYYILLIASIALIGFAIFGICTKKKRTDPDEKQPEEQPAC